MNTDLAVIDAEARVVAIEPVSDTRGAMERLAILQDFVRSVMVKGEDYGTIPGVSKPSLYKPGAEKLCELYGLAITLPEARRRSIENWDDGFWHYEVVCALVSRRTGQVVAEGIGSCNSREERYRRKEWYSGPQGSAPPAAEGWMRTRNGGWYRFVDNPSRWDLPNTLLKMAKKRALVDGVLSVTRSSGLFTQDVEEMSRELLGQDDRSTTAEHAEAKPVANGHKPVAPAGKTADRKQLVERFARLCKQAVEMGIEVPEMAPDATDDGYAAALANLAQRLNEALAARRESAEESDA
jgi:hypothetical protein